jgi:2-polyprenyl-6-methoxyphenol hydroxylase-like FAD-dependent oxidoreductase
VIREIAFGRLPHKYPFMLALSQATTERLLNDALAAAGQAVERSVEMVGCRNVAEGVEAVLRHPSDREETYHCPWMLACDGAHSTARQCLKIDFEGSKFERPWHLADLPLRTDLEHDLAHVEFLKGGGFVFLFRVVNEAADRTSKRGLWRVMSNLPDPVSRLSRAEPAGKPVWTSQFYISHRINGKLRAGNVYFAGDAAHVHSPIGARGMNLGLEDAAVFSHLARRHGLNRYEASRRTCDRRVVKQIELLSRMVMAESLGARAARALFMRWLIKAPFVRNTMLARVTGLDHDVELGQGHRQSRHERL